MKYKFLSFSLTALMILSIGCKKNEGSLSQTSDPAIASAKDYFDFLQHASPVSSSDPRFAASRSVDWSHATKVVFHGGMQAVVAPVQYLGSFYMGSSLDSVRYYSADQTTWLSIYEDTLKQYHAEQVCFFPGSKYLSNGTFSGLIFVDDWQGNALRKYLIEDNGAVWKEQLNASAGGQQVMSMNSAQPDLVTIIQTCYDIVGYNYSVDDPDGGVSWTQPGGCSYSIIDDGNGGGPSGADYGGMASSGGGGGSSPGVVKPSPANLFTVASGDNIIGNIKNYIQCFTNIVGSGNTFQVTVCVDQPVPGSRDAWAVSYNGSAGSSFGGNPANVGHTFLIFSQNTGGSIITRNVGFYPASNVSPRSPSAPGQPNNDALHEYNISLTIQVTNSQFFNMLNYVSQANDQQYNLNSNNCTSFAIKALNAGDIFLPSTIGTWPAGSGNDPGDLGEDIRSLNLSPDMTRNTQNTSHPNLGNCN